MKQKFNELIDIVNTKGFLYFADNMEQLETFIGDLKGLNNVNTSAYCKKIYYVLIELKDTLNDEYNELDILNLESTFNDYKEIVRKYLEMN